ncbi:DUF2283 domain-containing protein [Aurantimonas sp. Leaf443]|uniref:DUF2283 domain-containing protein n=1 Tax=Aurantimonas sp. Leaf443 TaxID=1736378 RepID=UPI00070156DC|nr:DUF2283 domain-containing protein [Aurantimonas sp. Leaf443]KQT87523.1 hypothetical protein ASG48_17175 [Aurantimonas sp. Leaf443]
MTYDPEADAVYLYVGKGKFDRTEEAGPFVYDVDAQGRVLGIEITCASTVLAPGAWQQAPLPSLPDANAAQ